MSHWENFYKQKSAPNKPSLFAEYVLNLFPEGPLHVVDVGCGNGRDAYFFGSNGYSVTGVDLNVRPDDTPQCQFIQSSMENLPDVNVDVVYSRFSLHSVPVETEDALLKWTKEHLTTSGVFCIEARSTNDPLNGTGEKVGTNEFLGKTSYADAHYRRFIDLNALTEKLKSMDFKIMHSSESDAYAPYKDQKPVCVRIVCSKN